VVRPPTAFVQSVLYLHFAIVVQLDQQCAQSKTLRMGVSDVYTYLKGDSNVTIWFDAELPDQAYCYHPYCWEFVKISVGHVTSEQLLSFAQSSKRLYNLPDRPSSGPASVAKSSAFPEMEFGKLYERFMSLPPELQKIVLEFAGPSPASSLINMKFYDRINLLLRTTVPSSYQEITCTISRRMTFHFVRIDGSLYWCGCEYNKGIVGYKGKTITAEIPRDVNILRFTIGCLGIRGLQFRGPSGESEFIGERGKSSWTGEMTCSDLFPHLLLGVDVRCKTRPVQAYADCILGS
jgi:hypothetical protein